MKEKKLASVRLSFSYPATWRVRVDDPGYFELTSPDGYQLGFRMEKASSFANANDATVKTTGAQVAEVIAKNDVGEAFVYADGSDLPYHSIAMTTHSFAVGDTFYTGDETDNPINPARKDLEVAISSGSSQSFKTLAEFDNQVSVKQAKLIYQSLKFY